MGIWAWLYPRTREITTCLLSRGGASLFHGVRGYPIISQYADSTHSCTDHVSRRRYQQSKVNRSLSAPAHPIRHNMLTASHRCAHRFFHFVDINHAKHHGCQPCFVSLLTTMFHFVRANRPRVSMTFFLPSSSIPVDTYNTYRCASYASIGGKQPCLTKATVGGMPPFSVVCLSQSHEWLCTPRMKMVKAVVSAQLRLPLHCGLNSSM